MVFWKEICPNGHLKEERGGRLSFSKEGGDRGRVRQSLFSGQKAFEGVVDKTIPPSVRSQEKEKGGSGSSDRGS